jgi:bifunctional DNA-binding transcriptional regulator/antitoxin component of YhaV-PrlF toxin-antitoxin module
MQRFAVKLNAGGQVTLQPEVRDGIGARPGDELSLVLDGTHATLARAEPGLARMREIARHARAAGATPDPGEDPIGDALVAEDERTKSRP